MKTNKSLVNYHIYFTYICYPTRSTFFCSCYFMQLYLAARSRAIKTIFEMVNFPIDAGTCSNTVKLFLY